MALDMTGDLLHLGITWKVAVVVLGVQSDVEVRNLGSEVRQAWEGRRG